MNTMAGPHQAGSAEYDDRQKIDSTYLFTNTQDGMIFPPNQAQADTLPSSDPGL